MRATVNTRDRVDIEIKYFEDLVDKLLSNYEGGSYDDLYMSLGEEFIDKLKINKYFDVFILGLEKYNIK